MDSGGSPDLLRAAKRLSAGDLTIATLSDGSGVLVDLAGMNVLSFNETGMFLIELLRRETDSPEKLVAALVDRFEVDPATARQDVVKFVDRLLSVMDETATPPMTP